MNKKDRITQENLSNSTQPARLQKETKVTNSGASRKNSHISSRNKRDQAKHDSK